MRTIVFEHFEMDTARRVLTARGLGVDLPSRSFDILAYLIDARDRVVSHQELLEAVWKGHAVVANNLTVQMSLLRRALADHGAPLLIVTVPRQGYRFVGNATTVQPVPVQAMPLHAAMANTAAMRPFDFLKARWRAAAGAAGFVGLCLGVGVGMAVREGSPASHLAARVRAETKPDTVIMAPESYCRVDYEFHVQDPVELQLATEDVRFYLTSGEPISPASIRSRIYHGSFPIKGPGMGVYHNNIYLPAWLVTAARAAGKQDLYLRHLFHLTDAGGREVDVPAVLQIVFGSPGSACRPVR